MAPGFALVEQGRRSRWAYVILGGSALVVRDGMVTGHLGRGDVVGATAVLAFAPAQYSVVAEWDLTVLVLGKREFTWLCERAPLAADGARRLPGSSRSPSSFP